MTTERGVHHSEQLHRRAVWLERFLVAYNLVEGAIAVTAGVIAGSVALVGFGFDSAIEVVAAGAVLWRLHTAGVEAGEEEHTRAEQRALLVVAATFVLLALYIGIEAAASLISAERPEDSLLGLGLAVASLIVMPSIAIAQQRTGRQMDSDAMVADAAETWVCTYLSFALLAGVGLNLLLGWWWADPVAALAMLPVVGWQAVAAYGEAREPRP
ncbi:MAG: cation transporter [Actinomycetota bacterium]|nr:cation transporter [Actinomycetota bacterium]